MNSKTIANGILRAFFIIAAIVLGIYFMNIILPVILYIVLALIITLIGRPFVMLLKHRLRFPNTVAVAVTMSIMLLIFAGFVSLFIPLIIKQSENLSLLNMAELRTNLHSMYIDFVSYFSRQDINIEKELEQAHILNSINFDFIPGFINGFIGFLGSFTIGLFSVLFITFFLLKDAKMIERIIMALAPKSKKRHFKRSMDTLKILLSRYFIGLGIQIGILFVIYTITLLIFGIENAVVIAFLCALINLIPYLGPLISFFLMIILTMTSNIGHDFTTYVLPRTVYVMIGFIIGQGIDNFFSQPFIFSNSVKSHPLEIFLVIIIAGLLSGPVGMVFCIPAYTALKVILKQFYPQNKFVRLLTKNL
ncbi:Predicted PurR-regulated permease PerM [Pustulibacterium marinum]|uniref:Predicted PurR-regulated permease PerM n=1 Tax=Pustulibacterium marinum TaxID=1224947 RepID=A0A1I7HXI4_9FLAO|nr:AI-2E family transporter [Pustulibacterium marinum]SFU65341.1 Predicted PurR-regulated permease PerM [Pustulibacterium marinum]